MPIPTPRFRWSLYEDEPLDTDSLLGTFFFVWRGVSIGSEATYVDSWLASFASLTEQLATKKAAEVEITEEPIGIRAVRRGRNINLYFNDVAIPRVPFVRFQSVLQAESRKFRKYVRAKAKGSVTEELKTIERFSRAGLAHVARGSRDQASAE